MIDVWFVLNGKPDSLYVNTYGPYLKLEDALALQLENIDFLYQVIPSNTEIKIIKVKEVFSEDSELKTLRTWERILDVANELTIH